jgi:hypothetical protein
MIGATFSKRIRGCPAFLAGTPRAFKVVFAFVILCVLASVAICALQNRNRVFRSTELENMYDALLRQANAEQLRRKIVFRVPKIGEKLLLDSLVLTDRNSEIILKYEQRDGNLPLDQIEEGLKEALQIGRFRSDPVERAVYQRIPERICYVLRDSFRSSFLDDFDISVSKLTGRVYVSTDSERVSRILPGEGVFFFSSGNTAEEVESGLVRNRRGVPTYRLIGLYLEPESPVTNRESGLRIVRLVEGSQAHRSGLMPGDVIAEVDGIKVHDVQVFFQLIHERAEKKTVRLKVTRESTHFEVELFVPRHGG